MFLIIVEQMTTIADGDDDAMRQGADGMREIKVGKLNLVDLAGCERVRVTGATG